MSKKTWNIPQTLNHLFMKEILSSLYLGTWGMFQAFVICWIFLDNGYPYHPMRLINPIAYEVNGR